MIDGVPRGPSLDPEELAEQGGDDYLDFLTSKLDAVKDAKMGGADGRKTMNLLGSSGSGDLGASSGGGDDGLLI